MNSGFYAFWDPERWTRDYGWRPLPGQDNPYTLGYHIGQDIGGGSWYGEVPILRKGKVVRAGRSSVIGGYIVVQADADDLFDGYAHLNTAPNNMPGVGERVTPGDSAGKLARSILPWAGDNYTGSGSTGPHLHFTVSYKVDNSWNPVKGYDLDPRPFIRTALRAPAPAGAGSTPFVPAVPKEEQEMITIRWNGAHVFTVGPEQVTHLDTPTLAREAASLTNSSGVYREVNDSHLTAVLTAYGIPWYAVDACMRGVALKTDGTQGGRYWSRSLEIKTDISISSKSTVKSIEGLIKTANAAA